MADFKLGRIKFKWRGNWATSTAFLIDDVCLLYTSDAADE